MQDRQTNDEMTAGGAHGTVTSYHLLWGGWAVALGATSLLVFLIMLPPFVDVVPRFALMQAFSFVCHQIPARSPSIDGVQLAVCHRCLGIYWGLPLAVLAFLVLRSWDARLNRNARYLMATALLAPGVDWGLGMTGLWHNTPVSRVATGAIFGFIAGYFLVRALAQTVHLAPEDAVGSRR